MGQRKRVGLGLGLFALLIAQVSCGDSSGPGNVPSSIAANSATDQTAAPGTEVLEPPSVIVRDQNGAVLGGVSVAFTVTSGGGSVTGGTVVTGADGVATVGSWTVGATEGTNTVTASSGSLSVTFTANGRDPCVIVAAHPIGGTTSGELTPADCRFSDGSFVDFYSTALTSAGTYSFIQSSATFDTYLILYDPVGSPIGYNDDFGAGQNSKVKAILPPGNFVLGANALEPNRLGAYSLTSVVDGGTVTNCEDVFVVRGVSSNQTLQTTDCMRNGGYYGDQLFLYAVAGQPVTVSMTSSAVDSYILIYDTNGSVLTQNDDKDASTKDAQLSFTPSVTGFYGIVPGSNVAGATGAYTVSVQ